MRPPWADSDSPWDRISFGTLAFGGIVEIRGDGIKLKTSRHRASGSNGARATNRGFDNADFTIKLIAWEDEHVAQFSAIRDLLFPTGRTAGTNAQPVTNPALAFARITQILAKEMSMPEFENGRLVTTIKASQYREPDPRAANATRRVRPATQDAQVAPGVQALYSANPIPAPSASGAASPPANVSR